MGYELAEQLGWTLPDVIFYPTGGGVGMIGMWKAFGEMEAQDASRANVETLGNEPPQITDVRFQGNLAQASYQTNDGLVRPANPPAEPAPLP